MLKLVKLVLLLSLVPALPLLGRQRLQGVCGQGGQQVSVANGAASSTTATGVATNWQQSFPSATVNVFLAGTTTLATIFADNSGTAKANPFTGSSTDASWFFYADNGRYDVQCSNNPPTQTGIASPFTFGDLEANDVGTGTPPTAACVPMVTGVLLAGCFAGADAGAKIIAAFAALPAGGGVVDARGLTGTQSSAPSITVPANSTLLLGATTLTMAIGMQMIYSSKSAIIGIGGTGQGSAPAASQIVGNVSSGGVISLPATGNAYNVYLANFTVQNTSTNMVGFPNTAAWGIQMSVWNPDRTTAASEVSHVQVSSSANGIQFGSQGYYNKFDQNFLEGTVTGGGQTGYYTNSTLAANQFNIIGGRVSGFDFGFDLHTSIGANLTGVDVESYANTGIRIGGTGTDAFGSRMELSGGYMQGAGASVNDIYVGAGSIDSLIMLPWIQGTATNTLNDNGTATVVIGLDPNRVTATSTGAYVSGFTLGGTDKGLAIRSNVGSVTFVLNDRSQTANLGIWGIRNQGTQLTFTAINDNLSIGTTPLNLFHSGLTQFAAFTVDPSGTFSTQPGSIVYRSDLTRMRYFDSAWHSIPGIDTTDTLTNKTLTTPLISSSTFASLPASTNGTIIFCSDCNATCTAGAGTGRTCFRENGAWTH
jgi:hypothetical protein